MGSWANSTINLVLLRCLTILWKQPRSKPKSSNRKCARLKESVRLANKMATLVSQLGLLMVPSHPLIQQSQEVTLMMNTTTVKNLFMILRRKRRRNVNLTKNRLST